MARTPVRPDDGVTRPAGHRDSSPETSSLSHSESNPGNGRSSIMLTQWTNRAVLPSVQMKACTCRIVVKCPGTMSADLGQMLAGNRYRMPCSRGIARSQTRRPKIDQSVAHIQRGSKRSAFPKGADLSVRHVPDCPTWAAVLYSALRRSAPSVPWPWRTALARSGTSRDFRMNFEQHQKQLRSAG